MFYLRSRGIPPKIAQRLIVSGFLNEVIQRLDQSAIAEHLNRLIEAKFALGK
jgi:Fe-S cluster assembly protein SufD